VKETKEKEKKRSILSEIKTNLNTNELFNFLTEDPFEEHHKNLQKNLKNLARLTRADSKSRISSVIADSIQSKIGKLEQAIKTLELQYKNNRIEPKVFKREYDKLNRKLIAVKKMDPRLYQKNAIKQYHEIIKKLLSEGADIGKAIKMEQTALEKSLNSSSNKKQLSNAYSDFLDAASLYFSESDKENFSEITVKNTIEDSFLQAGNSAGFFTPIKFNTASKTYLKEFLNEFKPKTIPEGNEEIGQDLLTLVSSTQPQVQITENTEKTNSDCTLS
jgi:DNA polymerase III alpha subunit